MAVGRPGRALSRCAHRAAPGTQLQGPFPFSPRHPAEFVLPGRGNAQFAIGHPTRVSVSVRVARRYSQLQDCADMAH